MTAAATSLAPRNTAGWITEWALDREHVFEPCAAALTTFSLDLVGLVVEFLQKPDAYDCARVFTAYGLAQVGTDYSPEEDIEAILQTNLQDVFNEYACAYWSGKRKVTEVFSLYFKPENLSPDKTAALASSQGMKLQHSGSAQIAQECRKTDPEAGYLFFPDVPIGQNMPYFEQCHMHLSEQDSHWLAQNGPLFGDPRKVDTVMPGKWKHPSAGDAIYCIFTKSACTEIQIYPAKPPTRTFTSAHIDDKSVAIGNFHDRVLSLYTLDSEDADICTGMALTRRVVAKLTSPVKLPSSDKA